MNPWQRICIGRRETHAVPGGMLKSIPKTMCTHDVPGSAVHVTSVDTGTNLRQRFFSCFANRGTHRVLSLRSAGPLYRCV